MTEKRVKGFCAFCRSRCGAVAVVENDRLVRLEPDPDHPTGAALCLKGKAAPEIHADPNRLLYPLRRSNPKGAADPGWRRISWDEALEEVAARMREAATTQGPESVAFAVASPSATSISDGLMWIERLVNRFGSPNLCNGTELCNWHKDHGHRYTIGHGIGSPDFARSEAIVLWGHNPSTSWLAHATAIAAARQRGAALIVVDPRRAGFAGSANLWLRVRPGTDAALALALIGEMIERRVYDVEFVRRWTNAPLLVRQDNGRLLRGADIDPTWLADSLVAWDELTDRPIRYDQARARYDTETCLPSLVDIRSMTTLDGGQIECATVLELLRRRCLDHTPETASIATGVPAKNIRATAALLGARRPVSYYCWTGVGQHANATQTDRAIAILMALTGSTDGPGGNVEFSRAATNSVDGAEFLGDEQRARMIGAERRPLGPARFGGGVAAADLYRAIRDVDPYPVRALVAFGSNLLLTRADPESGAAALRSLPFHVHAGPVLTPTAAFADIVLPVCAQWEREGLRVGFETNEDAAALVQFRRAALAPAGESRSDAWIVFQLAARLGFARDFWDGDLEAATDHHLAPSGLTIAALRKRPGGIAVTLPQRRRRHAEPTKNGFRGFDTPSRLIEFFSETFGDAGLDPLPAHARETADARFPLLLTSAKVPQYCHAQYREIPSLRRRMPDPLLEIHPVTAAVHGIGQGDWVFVSTASGTARLRARLESGMAAGVVCGQYGWSRPEADAADEDPINIARLIDSGAADPISGSVTHRGIPCAVARDAGG